MHSYPHMMGVASECNLLWKKYDGGMMGVGLYTTIYLHLKVYRLDSAPLMSKGNFVTRSFLGLDSWIIVFLFTKTYIGIFKTKISPYPSKCC